MKRIAIEEHFTVEEIERAIGSERTAPAPASPASSPLAAQFQMLTDVGTQRLRDMDAAGISMQVLSLTPPGAQTLDAVRAVALAREANDRLAEVIAAHPDRFSGFATLPTPDPGAAARELERAVTALGLKGAMIHGTTDGRFLDDATFWPIFAVAEQLDVPIYLHPAEPPQAVRDAYYGGFAPAVSQMLARGGWGWHIETGLHVLRLILAGVFDRFPRLQVIIGHMGESLPFMLARSTERLPTSVTRLPRTVAEYVREHVWVTTSGIFTFPPLLCTLLTVGSDRILFAVDYPFSPNEEARRFLDAMPVSPEDKERIAHNNAERLLKL